MTTRSPAADLEIQRIGLLYRQNITGLIAMCANSMAFLWIAWNHANRSVLVAWFVILNASLVIRVAATCLWERRKSRLTSLAEVERWHVFIKLTLLISGASWGYCGWISVHAPSPVQHIYAGLLVFGMSAGAIVTYAPSIWAMYAVIFPATLPWGVRLLLSGDVELGALGLLVLMFLVLGAKSGRTLNQFVNSFLRLNAKFRESEERLRMARDSSSAISWDWNTSEGSISCEGNLSSLFGVKLDRFSGALTDFIAKIPSNDRQKIADAFRKALSVGEIDQEISLKWQNGSEHWIAMRGRASSSQGGLFQRMTGICWDVTNKNNQEKLRRERDVLEAANKKQLVFLANVSHEIRTPLSAINGFSELMTRNPRLPADFLEPARTILRNGKYLLALVNDLLDLAKLETDQLYIQNARMSPVAEVKDSISLVQDSLSQKNLALSVVYDGLLPETICSDPVRFRQVLINLLVNAAKYTESGGIALHLSCIPSDGGSQGVFRVLVTDTGIGMSPETQLNLFKPFARGEDSRAKRVPGSGLGLALSHRLARSMGGELKLRSSSLGVGTTFDFTVATGALGEMRSFADASKASATAPLMHSVTVAQLSGKKILLVEDESDLRAMMTELLKLEGAQVDVAINGLEAVTRAFEQPYDAILMDIKMPVMDGYQSTNLLRKKGYRFPIIALTAHASALDRQKCLAAGCDDYLSKPIDSNLLLEILKSCRAETKPTAGAPGPNKAPEGANIEMDPAALPI